jgi:hypothetical protein
MGVTHPSIVKVTPPHRQLPVSKVMSSHPEDGRRPVAFGLAPGQAHELAHVVPLLARLPGVPVWVVADRGYSSHAFRDHVWNIGAPPAVPTRRDEAPVACPARSTTTETASSAPGRG